ncbi:MAG: DegV family protein [Bacillota bacterium]|nr:DegV family protein [Bacillota bacterium]
MEKIKIITDSTADLPRFIIEKYDIEVLPLLVNFGDESYLDGVDIMLPQLLDKIEHSGIFPTTSQINPERFYNCFKGYLDDGYKIVSLNLSSKLSGSYQSACIAKDMLETEDIVIIDSLNVTSGLGVLVIKACKLRDEGFGIKEIEQKLIEAIPHVKSALAFERLENLVRGGRLSKTAGAIGSILGIKPILAVEHGEMVVRDKVRGSKKAARIIMDYLNTKGVKEGETVILLQAENKDILPILREHLKENNRDFIESEVGCVVGTHSGTEACGLFFIEDY